MARKQIRLIKDDRFPEVEAAADAYVEVRDERAELSRKETQKRLELLAVMRAHKIKSYKFADNTGEIVEARIDDGDPKVTVKKTGEADSPIGEGVDTGEGEAPSGMAGLIAQAEADQGATNVEETEDGDITVPDAPAPKAKKSKGRKKS